MPPILPSRFPLHPGFLEKAVGCRATDLDSCHRRGFLPGMTSLHERDHLPFGCTVWLLFHRFTLSLTVSDAEGDLFSQPHRSQSTIGGMSLSRSAESNVA
jgi:hypothetical protein